MAERRMFAQSVIDSDLFLDMPISAQCLYFHLAMKADDDGFVNNPKRIQRMIGVSNDDMDELIKAQFVLVFDSGVVLIRHWKIHNFIKKDRYKPSRCEELEQVTLTEKKLYTLKGTDCIQTGYKMDTGCIQDGYVGKVRLDKVSLGKVSIAAAAAGACARENNIPDSKYQDGDEDLGACLRLFENNIHPLTGEIEKDKLLSLYDKYHREWVCEAIKEAAEYNGRSLKYIEGILTRWERDGFKAKKGDTYGRPQGGYGKSKKRLTPEEERAKWAKETPGWD